MNKLRKKLLIVKQMQEKCLSTGEVKSEKSMGSW